MNEESMVNGMLTISMDLLAGLEDKLLLPERIQAWRKAKSQSSLRFILEGSLNGEHSLTCHRMYEHFVQSNDRCLWDLIWIWVDSLYLDGTSVRRAEGTWSLLLAMIWADPDITRNHLSDATTSQLLKLQQSLIDKRKGIAAALNKVVPASVWDDLVLQTLQSELAFLKDKLALMCEYNALMIEWNALLRVDATEMENIYLCGRRIAKSIGLREVDVPFPSSWNFNPEVRKLNVDR